MYEGKSILELHELLVAKKVTPVDLVKDAIELAKKDTNNAFEYIMESEALAIAETLGEPEVDNLLWGIPFVVKDNMSTKDVLLLFRQHNLLETIRSQYAVLHTLDFDEAEEFAEEVLQVKGCFNKVNSYV